MSRSVGTGSDQGHSTGPEARPEPQRPDPQRPEPQHNEPQRTEGTLRGVALAAALLAIALGGFGIGSNEFVTMGLLPEIAQELLAPLWAVNQAEAIGQAGIVISAYALGVVVGAPIVTALTARAPQKLLLVAMLAWFALGTLLTVVMPGMVPVTLARFLVALPHGTYFGIASIVAARLMGPGRRGLGVSVVLSGLTIANVIGVPVMTALGQAIGWRMAYVVVAGIFALACLLVAIFVPHQQPDAAATMKRELRVFGRGSFWIAIAISAIGYGGFFAVYSYISPLAQHVTGLPAGAVPSVLVTMGVGMTVGNIAGGFVADRSVRLGLSTSFVILLVGCTGVALFAASPIALYAFVFVVGFASSYLVPSVQSRLLDVSGDAQSIAAAMNHSSLNMGNALGAAVGGTVIAWGLGYTAPAVAGIVLTLLGMLVAWSSFALSGSDRRRSGEARQ